MVCIVPKISRPTSLSIAQIGHVEIIFNIYGSDIVALALKPAMAVSVLRGVSHQSLCIPLIVNVYLCYT